MAALVKNMQPTTEEAAEKKGKKAKKGGDLADLAKQACKEACQEIALKDAADIAIFGRMVASDHTLTVEGAGMFGHALSTHKCENEIDFFSAVDDLKAADAEDAGAGHTGPIEFVAPCYYRYAALNLDLLYYQPQPPANLACLAGEAHAAERKAIVEAFIRATVQAVPNARKNSMNAHTFPAYVLGIVKDQGQPLQLVNAFEKPVCGRTGLVEPSVKAMLAHHAEMKKTWAIEPVEEVAIPDVTLPEFCQRLVAHVV
jgi:CRISPR system Cascade subunit CasC